MTRPHAQRPSIEMAAWQPDPIEAWWQRLIFWLGAKL